MCDRGTGWRFGEGWRAVVIANVMVVDGEESWVFNNSL